MNKKQFVKHLQELGAYEDAMLWLGERTAKQTFSECERGDWLIWWIRREINAGKKGFGTVNDVKRVALECAKLALPYMKDERRKRALIVVENYLDGNATREELIEARNAAYAADAAAAAAAADAAYAAADAAAYAAARTEIQKKTADIVRKYLSVPKSYK